ncbi:MAG: sugar transferase [Pelolinea sp.]|nr:sugar transferase [Pelolinea sp.]
MESNEKGTSARTVQALNGRMGLWVSKSVKRAFDIAGSFFGLVLLSPLFLITAVHIRRDTPGPVYYRGPRAGRGGRVFQILKFRTMYETPESYSGHRITGQDDGRVTPVGEWLRRTKLNELPQLWNVLVGEMSFVGPRPEDPEIAAKWSEEVRGEIFSVRPGITSPASVIFRDEQKLLKHSSVMDDYFQSVLPEKLRLDQLYVRHHTLIGDLDVIFMTLIILLPGLRQSVVPETTLYSGAVYNFCRRYLSWFILDTLTAFIAVSVTGVLWRTAAPLDLGLEFAASIALGIALLFGIINTMLGLGNVPWRQAPAIHVVELAFSTSLVVGVAASVNQFWPNGHFLPFGMIVYSGMLSFFGFVIIRYRERLITGLATRWIQTRKQTSLIGEHVLVVGAGRCGKLATWLIENSDLAPAFSIAGIVDDDFFKQRYTINGYPVLGTTHDISALVEKKNIGLIVFAIRNLTPANKKRILAQCRDSQARLLMIPDLLTVLDEYLMKQIQEE